MAQSTDVMFAIPFLVRTSKDYPAFYISSSLHHFKNNNKIDIKVRDTEKSWQSKTWLRKSRQIFEVKKSIFACIDYIIEILVQGFKSFLLVVVWITEMWVIIHERGVFEGCTIFSGFIIWSICFYNIKNMLLLGFMHRLGFKLYGGQKMGTMIVFWPTTNFH